MEKTSTRVKLGFDFNFPIPDPKDKKSSEFLFYFIFDDEYGNPIVKSKSGPQFGAIIKAKIVSHNKCIITAYYRKHVGQF